MSFIEPLEITDTHVIISVLISQALAWSGLGAYWSFWNNMKSVCGQVLLFRQPNIIMSRMQILNMLLLEKNVDLDKADIVQPEVLSWSDSQCLRSNSKCLSSNSKVSKASLSQLLNKLLDCQV
ncbi:hypothetical protein INR49_004857, partial [Caranx melampygus]